MEESINTHNNECFKVWTWNFMYIVFFSVHTDKLTGPQKQRGPPKITYLGFKAKPFCLPRQGW